MTHKGLGSSYWATKQCMCPFCEAYLTMDDSDDLVKSTLWRHVFSKHDWVRVASQLCIEREARNRETADENGNALQCGICHQAIEEAHTDYRSEFRLLAHIVLLPPEERQAHIVAMLMQ